MTLINQGTGDGKVIQLHETRHGLNHFFMSDHRNNEKAITVAKDEILAFLVDGTDVRRIENTLTDENGIYNFYRHNRNDPSYERLWTEHVDEVEKLTEVVRRFQSLYLPYYIDILALTPAEHWGEVLKIYEGTANAEEKVRLHARLMKTLGIE